MSASNIVTVTVPVAFQISVEVPANSGANQRVLAEALAAYAAEHFAHVSQAQIHAFNEVNRIHPHGTGVITAVSSGVDAAQKTAA
ncbi:hypothetical protein [Azospirillum sp. TSO22-1]|uniref:hypothetical protein n=1 Tax=Azospirillum sp. TSO22-1 TaxID=716789 RepID=UPI000D61E66F|nr:hypothetical protein [Azospirillum sp. TSO22-1]PWC41449.1 hypothetical protein TSO221_23245 [Azospirillum sp. TSO22-1]